MFHLVSALRCIIRSSAWLFPVTQTWEWKHASHKKSYRFDQQKCVRRGQHQRDKAQTVLATPLKWEMNNMRSGCMSQAEGMRWRHGAWITKNVPKHRRDVSSVPASAVIWNRERLKPWLHTSRPLNPDFFLRPVIVWTLKMRMCSFLKKEMTNFTQIWTFSPKRLVMSDSGSVFSFCH